MGANGAVDSQNRMDSISQLVLSRTNLLRIATTLGLYAGPAGQRQGHG